MNYNFEQMSPEHENDVMEIFNHYSENSFAAYPEGRVPNQLFLKFLEIGRAYPSFVIRSDEGAVAGFLPAPPVQPLCGI